MSTTEMIKRGLEDIANRDCLFEFNDERLRKLFADSFRLWVEDIPAKDVRVVCDELNNIMDIIKEGGFNADIYFTPLEAPKEVHLQMEVRRVPQQFVGEFVCDVVKG